MGITPSSRRNLYMYLFVSLQSKDHLRTKKPSGASRNSAPHGHVSGTKWPPSIILPAGELASLTGSRRTNDGARNGNGTVVKDTGEGGGGGGSVRVVGLAPILPSVLKKTNSGGFARASRVSFDPFITKDDNDSDPLRRVRVPMTFITVVMTIGSQR